MDIKEKQKFMRMLKKYNSIALFSKSLGRICSYHYDRIYTLSSDSHNVGLFSDKYIGMLNIENIESYEYNPETGYLNVFLLN